VRRGRRKVSSIRARGPSQMMKMARGPWTWALFRLLSACPPGTVKRNLDPRPPHEARVQEVKRDAMIAMAASP
jgi:hypothetical protein